VAQIRAAADPSWVPDGIERYLRHRQTLGPNRLVAQAHPPTLLLAVALLIWLLGAYGAYTLLTLMSIAAAAVTSHLLLSAWYPEASSAERWLAALALVSWQPVLASIRDDQVSIIVGALLVAAWSAARTGRPARGGALVWIASIVKLYLAVLLVLLAVRRRTGLAVAVSLMMGPPRSSRRSRASECGVSTWRPLTRSAMLLPDRPITFPSLPD
jgi:hypothetical protein